jgi:hypothetical protein
MIYKSKTGAEVLQRPQELRAGVNTTFVSEGQGQGIIQNDVAVAVANTNGTTNVSVFGASGLPFPIVVTGVFLVSLDTTAGNITVENGSSTIVTIAKGTVAGVMVGGVNIANASVAAGTNLQVDSSSAGNARVFITYRPA